MPARVVICGGGVIGAAIAYELARRGTPPVIVESDGVASGASGAAAGILTPPPPGTEADALDALRRLGFDGHARLADSLPVESGIDYGYQHTPRLVLATTPLEERALRETAAALAAAGHDARWLPAHEVRALTGWVDRGASGGVQVEPSAQVDPYRYTLALVTAAERRGATVRSGRVEGLVRDGGRVTGVRVSGAVLPADAAVIAMGPWSADAARWLGLPVPVEPLKGQIVKVRPPHALPAFSFGHGGNYAITKERGLVYLGTTEERVGFDRSTTPEAREAILAWGLGFASVLERAELVEQTACLRPLSADGMPIMGAVPGVGGAFLATGHGRQGILMSPATGRALADLVLDGRTDCLDLAPFDPARFLRGGR
ncbi:MAG: FAD-binding oxidoreductase [Chloroflexi bacterium]|nr:FAD-binding oxidoreductase [Chloroflexota bacterium]